MAHEMRNLDWSAQVQRLSPVMPTAPALLVGGMHRSGTSALTRVLALAGADLPRTLMPAGSDNPLGFWESVPIAAVNDEVLAEVGSHWDDVFGFESRPEAAGLRQAAIAKIRQAVQAEFDATAMPVIKDPRISLLMPVWDLALREAGHSPYAIGVVRHPMEVAQSLMRRDGFPVAKSLLLWLAYFIAFERDTRGMPRVFVAYSDLLDDWRGALARIEKKLGLYLPKRGHASDLDIERFLTREGRHHHAGEESLQRGDLAAPWIVKAYDWAKRAARDEAEPDAAELDAVRADMSVAAAAFAPVMVDLSQRLGRASREAKEVARLRLEVKRLGNELAQTTSDREAERNTAVAAIERLTIERDTERQTIESEFRRLDAERGAERFAATRERERLQQAVREGERIARESQQAMRENERITREQLAYQETLRLEADTERMRLEGALVQIRAERDRLQAEARRNSEMLLAAARVPELESALAQTRKATLLMQAERDEETHRANSLAVEREAMTRFIARNRKLGAKLRSQLWRRSWARPLSDALSLVNLSLSRGPSQAARALHMARTIRKSGDFDVAYYLHRNWDVTALGQDPVLHYVVAGAREMRDPSPAFSTRGYIERHGDVARVGDPALFHFVSHGRAEGRLPVKVDGASSAPPRIEPAAARRETGNGARHSYAPNDPYGLRPDDGVLVEARTGEDFCHQHGLMGPSPDFAGAVETINRLFAVAPPAATGAGIDASIVIPVYGQLAYTLNALHALAQHKSRHAFEIIVVDDCSPDASATWLAKIPAIRLLQQPQNGGFIESCNAGAKLASGRYYVMLNNDTRVCPGWLDELIGSFAVLPNAGLIGSKLFYSDGSLQEAGGILWRDGSAWNYGRGDDPGKPEYCYARSVDYVSGASIAVPADVWRQLGGFDAHYRPAYGEDSDFALKVRHRLGRGVWMQPLSRVIHYEGKTSGTDTGSGTKAYQVANARKLRERWQGELSLHRANGEAPLLERDRGAVKRALVLDATTPEPDKDAGSLTCFELMRALQANGYKVTFLAETNLLFLPGPSSGLQRAGIEVGYAPYVSSIPDWLETHGREVDVVLLFRNGVAARQIKDVRKYCPNARVVFHSSDLHFLREEREAGLSSDARLLAQAQETRRSELAIIRSADATIVHSTFEADVLNEAAPGANVAVFPWILDAKGCKAPFARRRDIAFLGGYRHPPNADAVRYFVKEIWPLVRARDPGMRFIIAGSEMPDDLAAMHGRDNVVAQGYVADLDQFFEAIRLTVAPIRYGAGIKGKVAMSFAYGVPAVLTPCAAEGMGLVDGEISLTREDPQAFADAILALYPDEPRWRRMSAAAMAFVEQTYGSALGHRRMAEIIASASAASR